MMAQTGSLRLRLLLGTMAAVGAAMLLAGLFIADLFAAHVRRTVEEDLTHHLSELVTHSRIGEDGSATVSRPLSDPRFQEPGSGMTWRIDRTARPPVLSASTVDGPPPSSRTVTRSVTLTLGGRGTTFSIHEDGRLLDAEIAAFHTDLALSLAALGLLLSAGIVLQHRHGLRPIVRLGNDVEALRRGRRDRLSEDVPSEFRSLVDRLNELLHSQSVLVERGRLEAGNLAHALRTPLALVSDEAERLHDTDGSAAADFIRQQCTAMGRQIDYHMRRAAAGGTGRIDTATTLAPVLKRIITAMNRLHNRTGCTVHVDVAPEMAVQADAGDLFEALSNLIDNAYKWAVAEIRITARRRGEAIMLTIADDGPGIPPERRTDMLAAGTRLDESVSGHGLGLAIASDLIGMNDGRIQLGSSDIGGLEVLLVLRSPS